MSQSKKAKAKMYTTAKGFQFQIEPKSALAPKGVELRPYLKAISKPSSQAQEAFEALVPSRDQAKPLEPVEETLEPFDKPQVKTLEELKQEAKTLGIKGWNFYKDPAKLQDKITQFKETK